MHRENKWQVRIYSRGKIRYRRMKTELFTIIELLHPTDQTVP